MQSFIMSHSSCAEQYGAMSSDTQIHTHTIKPPTDGFQLVVHTSNSITYWTRLLIDDLLDVTKWQQMVDVCTCTKARFGKGDDGFDYDDDVIAE